MICSGTLKKKLINSGFNVSKTLILTLMTKNVIITQLICLKINWTSFIKIHVNWLESWLNNWCLVRRLMDSSDGESLKMGSTHWAKTTNKHSTISAGLFVTNLLVDTRKISSPQHERRKMVCLCQTIKNNDLNIVSKVASLKDDACVWDCSRHFLWTFKQPDCHSRFLRLVSLLT